MSQHRIDRITEDILRELTFILRELKDPRIAPMTSIVRVEVSNDLSYAKVLVSSIGGTDETRETVNGLRSASGYIRRELGQRLRLRKTPELTFIADDSIAHSAEIARMLSGLDIGQDDNMQGDGSDDDNA